MDRKQIVFLALLAVAAGCKPATAEDLPPFVQQLIEQYEGGAESNSPGSIWRYNYGNAVVFYVPPFFCCDLPSRLYDVQGNVVCAPDGGIAGVGDGKCPDFFDMRKGGIRVWIDSRVEASK